MKALTIKQPWANLIMRAGKDIENREWPTSFRGRIAVTASAKFEYEELLYAMEFMKSWLPRFSPRIFELEARGYNCACILGTVEIIDCVQASDSPWFCGTYGFVLRNPVMLEKPIPIRGALGLWTLPEEAERELLKGLSL